MGVAHSCTQLEAAGNLIPSRKKLEGLFLMLCPASAIAGGTQRREGVSRRNMSPPSITMSVEFYRTRPVSTPTWRDSPAPQKFQLL